MSNEVKQYVVNDIIQYVNSLFAISTLLDSLPWWRGHCDANWKLIPSVHHREMTNKEVNMTFRFKNMAKSRYPKCPLNSDLPSWLFLMQHYNLPTRLLDWSESPLIALFFATEDPELDKNDGIVWGLSPTRLNKSQGEEPKIFSGDHPSVITIFNEAFSKSKTNSSKTLAVLVDQIDIRQMVQLSQFTIHGNNVPIEEKDEAEYFLGKVIIPKEKKEYFRTVLKLFGINRASIFPDLENLSHELCRSTFKEESESGSD
jgi:hypothetical protein